MTPSHNFCGSHEHDLSRRSFLGGLSAVGAGLLGTSGAVNTFAADGLNAALKKGNKRVILLWLAGGASQLETWDPKPGVPTGGPFADIPTDIPGVHISELMPKMAKRMKHSCLIRSLNTKDGGHGGGADLMLRGRRDEPTLKYPDLGAVVAKELGRMDSQVPDYVNFYTSTEGRGSAKTTPGFLGARYGAINLHDGKKLSLPNIEKLESITKGDHEARADLRNFLSSRFDQGRGLSAVKSHAAAYARVHGLMSCEKLFDISDEPQHIRDMYGPTQFAEQTIMARRMVEAGVPFVRVSRAWWDSHGQNFETHLEMVPELDRVLSALIDDLKQRGMLEDTLVVTMGEFGRTPKINGSLGRDHFATAWSASLHGGRTVPGAVYGKTDAHGNRVVEGEIGAGEMFATILEAAGIDHTREYHVGARPIPLVNPGIKPVTEVIA
ncbi:MAG: DUF1501 domain-containing protein [Pedosphaera sp.]|nr:DUF1501 domain-containing protein [Pedosphaera sp.]